MGGGYGHGEEKTNTRQSKFQLPLDVTLPKRLLWMENLEMKKTLLEALSDQKRNPENNEKASFSYAFLLDFILDYSE